MKLDRFLNQRNDFIASLRSRDATRQIRDIGPITIVTFLYDYQIFHGHYFNPARLKEGLLLGLCTNRGGDVAPTIYRGHGLLLQGDAVDLGVAVEVGAAGDYCLAAGEPCVALEVVFAHTVNAEVNG
jgi:hypothetical protein